MAHEFRHVQSGDQSIRVAVMGSGPLVLMVQGWLSHSEAATRPSELPWGTPATRMGSILLSSGYDGRGDARDLGRQGPKAITAKNVTMGRACRLSFGDARSRKSCAC